MWLACLNGWPSYNNFANKENKLNLPIDVMTLFLIAYTIKSCMTLGIKLLTIMKANNY